MSLQNTTNLISGYTGDVSCQNWERESTFQPWDVSGGIRSGNYP